MFIEGKIYFREDVESTEKELMLIKTINDDFVVVDSLIVDDYGEGILIQDDNTIYRENFDEIYKFDDYVVTSITEKEFNGLYSELLEYEHIAITQGFDECFVAQKERLMNFINQYNL
jgi:hypothetical protein